MGENTRWWKDRSRVSNMNMYPNRTWFVGYKLYGQTIAQLISAGIIDHID